MMEDTLIVTKLESNTALDQFVKRAKSLYSLPAVAAEVLELTASPRVDNAALKACIERDPALTVRILRVVNSSLFGLSHPVSNLKQAITMLGIKPLKLLVLGFSLPESLFVNLARQQLEWYWSTTLVRAVAAREISEQWFELPGDEPFLAGLLQDIGMLALLGQLREPYALFLAGAIGREANLEELETEILGFDHLALSAALLRQWNMPVQLGRAIANIRQRQIHTSGETATDHLTRVLQLATLLGELVGRHRLCALPELLELGSVYCELDKSRLSELVADLQPKVEQLAEVLALRLPAGREYSDLLVAAHAQMSALADEEDEEEVDAQVQRESAQLGIAVQAFLRGAPANPAQTALKIPSVGSPQTMVFDRTFEQRLVIALGKCRSERQPLSVVMLDVSWENQSSEQDKLLSDFLDRTCREEFCSLTELDVSNPSSRTLVLPGCDRQEAVRMARGAIHTIETSWQRQNVLDQKGPIQVRVGIASATLPSKNFDAVRLLQTAQRCLAASRTCGTSCVKSLEIY